MYNTQENFTKLDRKKNITIKGSYLKTQQYVHALLMHVIPLLGTIIAVAIALRSGIGSVEIGLLVSLYVLTVIGITVGFHRFFSHAAFQTNAAITVILGILGSMAFQGPLIYWVSNHRRHHQYSDQPGDVHSPYYMKEEKLDSIRGLWHAQIGWTFTHEITNTFLFAKDLLQNPLTAKINQLYYVWVLLGFVIPTVLGGILTGTSMGLVSGFLWGGCVRIFLSYNVTSSVNSIAHLYGRRPFKTRGHSTNNIWLAIPSLGGSWHNNHHAFPNTAINQFEWWQIDFSGWLIRLLEVLGLAWNVKFPTRAMIEAKKAS